MQTFQTLLPAVVAAAVTLIASSSPLAVDAAPVEQKPPPDRTYSSFDRPTPGAKEETFPPSLIKFQDTDLQEVLKIYQTISGRTIIRAGSLPPTTITLENQRPLTRREALQLLDTALAQVSITMIPQGTGYMKVVPQAQAAAESAPIPDLTPEQLPDSQSYMTYIVELNWPRPSNLAAALAPFSKCSNSVLIIPDAEVVILRDYSANIRRMLQVLGRLERAHKLRQGRGEQPAVERVPAP